MLRVALSFILHLVGDFFGSGPGWGLILFWPLSDSEVIFRSAWELNAWPNIAVTLIAMVYLVRVARTQAVTPVEFINPGLDRTFCDHIQLGFATPCQSCEKADGSTIRAARVRCADCREPSCLEHTRKKTRYEFRCFGCDEKRSAECSA